MAMTFADDFNRSDQNLEASANWTRIGSPAGALQILTNRVRCTTSGVDVAYQAPDPGTSDHYVQTKLLDVGSYGGGASFIACRIASDFNYVGVRWTGSAWSIFRRTTAGGYNSIGSFGSPAPSVGDIIRLQCQGTNYTLFRNGVSIGTGAIGDASLTSSRTGLIARSATQDPWVDDFETGTLVLAKSGSGVSTVSSSLSKVGHKGAKGAKALSLATSLARIGHKVAHASVAIAAHSSLAKLGHKGAHGFGSMHGVLTMTGGSVIDKLYSGFDVELDGALPGDINLIGRIYDGSD